MLLVFGSINADLLFQVEKLPSPGETVLCPGYDVAPGGKGANQAAAAAKSGGTVRMVGQVGEDDHGRSMVDNLRFAGVDISGIAISARPTGIAVIGIDHAGENQITVASGANLDVRATQVEDSELSPATTLLCQNEVESAETFELIRRASRNGARTVLNLAPAATVPADVLDALDVLIVNEVEAAMAAGDDDRPPVELAGDLAERHDLACVVTLGARGAVVRTPGAGWRVDAMPVDPVDTTGAGDTFVGVLAAALDGGHVIEVGLRRAAVAAALSCKVVGAQQGQPSADLVAEHLSALAPPQPMD